jgi:hypothetical protein
VSLLSSEEVGDESRELAIYASSFTFQARDANLVHSTNIFPLLQKIFSRVPKNVTIPDATTTAVSDDLRHNKLEETAFSCFRLLSLQCTWEDYNPEDEPAIVSLQQQIFVLVSTELERLSKKFSKYYLGDNVEPEGQFGERCYQLLSLIHLFISDGSNLMSLNFFSDLRCLRCFFALLGTNLVCFHSFYSNSNFMTS